MACEEDDSLLACSYFSRSCFWAQGRSAAAAVSSSLLLTFPPDALPVVAVVGGQGEHAHTD